VISRRKFAWLFPFLFAQCRLHLLPFTDLYFRGFPSRPILARYMSCAENVDHRSRSRLA
jgi:hypothetical protein